MRCWLHWPACKVRANIRWRGPCSTPRTPAGCSGSPRNSPRAVPGRGTEGETDGRSYLIGSLRWAQEMDADWAADPSLAERIAALQATGATLSCALERLADGRLRPRALLAFGDEPKTGVAEVLHTLRQRGLRVVMITGDSRAAALAMADRLGFAAAEVRADVLPGDKAAVVQQLQRGDEQAAPLDKRLLRHVVAMVGDGVNDAPALAAADVGIAMGTGTDVAMHAAGITLMRGDVALVASALDLSARTTAKIRQNLFWAFIYNVLGIPLAMFGLLSPVAAGAVMALSSVCVTGNALLLRRWQPRPC